MTSRDPPWTKSVAETKDDSLAELHYNFWSGIESMFKGSVVQDVVQYVVHPRKKQKCDIHPATSTDGINETVEEGVAGDLVEGMTGEEAETYEFVKRHFETVFHQTFRLCAPSEWPKGQKPWKTPNLVEKMKVRGTWQSITKQQLPNAYARKFIKGANSVFDNSALNFYLRRRFRGTKGAKNLTANDGKEISKQTPSFTCFVE